MGLDRNEPRTSQDPILLLSAKEVEREYLLYALQVETLVHAEPKHSKRDKNNERSQVSWHHALEVVNKWALWMRKEPYCESAQEM